MLALMSVALAATPLRVVVLDPGGRPIPTASVVFDAEGDYHSVNTADGSWEGDTLWPDSTGIEFQPGLWVHLTANAPGYWSSGVRHEMAIAGNRVVLTLFPMRIPDAPASPASSLRDRTMALSDAWARAMLDPDANRDFARRKLGFAAREWAEVSLVTASPDAEIALAICHAAGNRGCPLR